MEIVRASSFELIRNCRASYKYTKLNYGSEFTNEGRAFHEAFKQRIIGGFVEYDKIKLSFGLSNDEIGFIQHYVNQIDLQIPENAEVIVEKDIFLGIHPTYDLYLKGCPDIAIMYGHECWIPDWKYGRGHVRPASNNSQLLIYAMLLHNKFPHLDTFHVSIMQPRINHESKHTFTSQDLRILFPEIVKVSIECLTEEFQNEYVYGAWCTDCKGKFECELFAGRVQKFLSLIGKTKEIHPVKETLQELFPLAKSITPIIKAIENLAKAYVDEHEVLELGGNRRYVKESSAKEEILSEEVFDALDEFFDESEKKSAIRFTKDSICSVAKEKKRGLAGKILDKLREKKAIVSTPTFKYSLKK